MRSEIYPEPLMRLAFNRDFLTGWNEGAERPPQIGSRQTDVFLTGRYLRSSGEGRSQRSLFICSWYFVVIATRGEISSQHIRDEGL